MVLGPNLRVHRCSWVSWKTRNPEFRRNSAGIFKSMFFCQFKGIEEFPKIFRSPNIRRIFSEDDPRVTEVSQTSLTNNRTNEDAPMAFRLICMYPEDYSICYDLSLCRVPVIRESRALIIRACQSRTVKMRVAN